MFGFDLREWEEAYICERKARTAHLCCACRERIAKRELYVEDHAPNESFSRSLRFHKRCAIGKGIIPILTGNRFRVVRTTTKGDREAYKIETDEGSSLVLDIRQVEELISGLQRLAIP